MCGIVGFTGSQNAAPILLDGLKKLEYRGYDSAGMAVLGQDGIQMVKTRTTRRREGRPFQAPPASAIPAGPPMGSPRMSMPIPT